MQDILGLETPAKAKKGFVHKVTGSAIRVVRLGIIILHGDCDEL